MQPGKPGIAEDGRKYRISIVGVGRWPRRGFTTPP